jgi:uncharacterized membrane protein YbhN (UPF0104 family)
MNYGVSEKNFESHVRVRKWYYRLVVWALALLVLSALIQKSDWTFTLSQVAQIPISVVLICTVGWLLSFVLRAFRFMSEWQKVGSISFFAALRLTFLHNAAVLLVPFRVGELGYPALVQNLIKVTWQQCIRSLLWLRFQDGVVLVSIAFLILPFFKFEVRLLTMLAVLLLLLMAKPWLSKLIRSRHFLIVQLRAFLHQQNNSWGWFWSSANWVIKIWVVAFMLSSLMQLPMHQTLNGAVAGEMSAMLPLTGPAGFGSYEAGVWAGMALPWHDIKNLMACILLSHVFFVSISLFGAFLFVLVDALHFVKFEGEKK